MCQSSIFFFQVICTGSFTPSEATLPKQFPLDGPLMGVALLICIVLGVLIERQKYKNGKDERPQSTKIANQKIPNQDSIIGNLLIITIYLFNFYFLLKMNQ